MSKHLDSFFAERRVRLSKLDAKEAAETETLRITPDGTIEEDAALMRDNGAAEYQALKDEVFAIAREYKINGFECDGERQVSLGRSQIQFGPARTVKGVPPLVVAQVSFGMMSEGGLRLARPTVQRIDLEQTVERREIRWRTPGDPHPKTTAETAEWLIATLSDHADGRS